MLFAYLWQVLKNPNPLDYVLSVKICAIVRGYVIRKLFLVLLKEESFKTLCNN